MSSERLYAPDTNLWLEPDGAGALLVGLAPRIAVLFGVPEYAALPSPGDEIVPNVPFGSLENAKTALDLALPFAAVVTALETAADPGAVRAALDAGRALLRVRPSGDDWREGLLDEAGYHAFVSP